jgi:hypothetical protein
VIDSVTPELNACWYSEETKIEMATVAVNVIVDSFSGL